jgi:hypothetical protein
MYLSCPSLSLVRNVDSGMTCECVEEVREDLLLLLASDEPPWLKEHSDAESSEAGEPPPHLAGQGSA